MTKDEIPNGYGATALDQNIVRQFFTGYGVVTGCAPSYSGTGMNIDIATGTAWHNGSQVSISAQTVTISDGGSDPRKDLIYLDGTGSTQVIEGSPAAKAESQDVSTAFELFQPAPPDMTSTDGVLVAEIFIPANATSLDSSKVRDRRVTSDVAFDTLATYAATIQNSLTVQSGATVDVGGNRVTGTGGLDAPEDSGAVTLADMSVSSSPAAGTEESFGISIDGTQLVEAYAEADGAGGIQNQAVNFGASISATGTATIDGADIEVDHFSQGDGGLIVAGDAAVLYVTDVQDGGTIYVTRATHLHSDGTAAPTGVDLGIVTLDGTGGGTWQTTILSGDGSTIFSDETAGWSYSNASGGPQTVAIVCDNGNFAGASGGSGNDEDMKNDVNGRVA